jgi:hypothetical protein
VIPDFVNRFREIAIATFEETFEVSEPTWIGHALE